MFLIFDTAQEGKGTRTSFPNQPQHQRTNCLYAVCRYCLNWKRMITDNRMTLTRLTVVQFPVEHLSHSAVVRKSKQSEVPTRQDKLSETLDAT